MMIAGRRNLSKGWPKRKRASKGGKNLNPKNNTKIPTWLKPYLMHLLMQI